MKKIACIALGLITLALSTPKVSAQDTNTDSHTLNISIAELSLINIAGASGITTITLSPTTTTAGAAPTAAANSSLWLNVTSVVTAQTRTINVKTSATIPGFDIKVQAASCTSGDGTFGTVVGSPVTLTTSDQPIITAIGTCYTGTGTSSGYNLTYQAVANTNFENVTASNGSATITYTITNN